MRFPLPTDSGCYVGLMSGTSLDAIDAVLVEIGPGAIQLRAQHDHPLPPALKADLAGLCNPTPEMGDTVELLGAADRQLGEVLAAAVSALLTRAAVPAAQVVAIGSHGQTVRHRPPCGASGYPPCGAHHYPPRGTRHYPFTLQIGDPHVIAARTGIAVVADFRRRDLAVGGQGAPLVPAFHRAAFAHPERVRAIVNIGGIANLTLLPPGGEVLGFDTGPGNGLMDAWIQRHQGAGFDAGGSWAAAHRADADLLARLLAHPFLARQPPKSTGREEFHLGWVDDLLAAGPPVAPGRVQATLLELTAATIADAVCGLSPAVEEVYLCGGGAYNAALLKRLGELLHPRPVATTAALGLAPEWVEAVAFAWLARETLLGRPGNLPGVTGAAAAVVLGAIYPA